MSDEMKLRALFDGLADSVDEVSDDDLVAEAVGIGRSSENIANETLSILMAAVQQVDQRSTVLLGTGETSSMSSPASVPLPTALGELPDFHALDPLAFRDCVAIFTKSSPTSRLQKSSEPPANLSAASISLRSIVLMALSVLASANALRPRLLP